MNAGGTEVARLFARVDADLSGFKRGMREVESESRKAATAASNNAKRFGDFAQKAAPYALALGGAMAFGAKKGIDAASDMNESLSKTQNLFGEAAKTIPGFAGSAARAFGMSRQAAMENASSIGAMLIPMGKSQQEAAKMSARMLKLAADMGSFHNQDPSEMLDRIRAGLSGESEPLKRFGINLSEGAVAAKAMSMGLVKMTVDSDALAEARARGAKAHSEAAYALHTYGRSSAEYAEKAAKASKIDKQIDKLMEGKAPKLDEATKLEARYALAIEQAGVANDDLARTADGAANRQKEMAARTADLTASLGAGLLPVYNRLLTVGIKVIEFFSRHQTATKVLIGVVGAFVAVTLAAAAAAKLKATWAGVLAVKEFVVAAATKGWAAAQWLLNAAMTANPIGIAVIAIAALAAAIVIAYKKSETFRGIVDKAWDAVKRGGEWVAATATTIGHFAGKIVDAFGDVLAWVRRHWRTIATLISGPFAPAVALATDAFGIRSKLVAALDWLKGAAGTAAGAVWTAIKTAITAPIRFVQWLTDTVVKPIRGVVSDVTAAGRSVGKGLWDGITGAAKAGARAVYNGIRAVINGILGVVDKIPFVDLKWRMPDAKDVPGFARGGVVRGPTLIEAGEDGAEVIVPVSPGKRALGRKWLAVAGNMLGGVEGNVPAFATGGVVYSGGFDSVVRSALLAQNTPTAWDRVGAWAAGGLGAILDRIPRPSLANPLAQGLAMIPYQAARSMVTGIHGSMGDLNIEKIDDAVRWMRSKMGNAYLWGGGHGGWDWDRANFDCSGFASHGAKRAGSTIPHPGTTGVTMGWSRASGGIGKNGPIQWGWRGMGSGARGEHMGIKGYGTWYQFGNPGRSGGTDSQWTTLGVPPGLPQLAGGGYVMQDGAAIVHRGEYVTRGPVEVNVTVAPGTGINREQARMLARELQPELDRLVRIA